VVTPTHRLVPFRDFLVEYPPGFFLVALPPAALSQSARGYALAFGAWMLLMLVLAVYWSASLAAKIQGDVSATAIAIGTAVGAMALGLVVTQRYDAAVSMLLCAMCWAATARKPVVAGIAAGAAVAVKIVPGIVAVLCGLYLLSEQRRRELRVATAAAALTTVVLWAPAAIAAPAGMLDMIRYHRDRPLEIGSTGAALLGLWHAVDPSSARMVLSFGSSNVVGRFDREVLFLSVVSSIISVAGTWLWAWRRLRASPTSGARAHVLVCAASMALAFVIATNKVGSPQYLVWLLPLGVLATLVDGRVVTKLQLFGAFALAQIAFPFGLSAAEALEPWPFGVLLLRNLSLAAWAMTIAARAGEPSDQ